MSKWHIDRVKKVTSAQVLKALNAPSSADIGLVHYTHDDCLSVSWIEGSRNGCHKHHNIDLTHKTLIKMFDVPKNSYVTISSDGSVAFAWKEKCKHK